MDANQTSDYLLSLVQISNLNFNLSESPFSLTLNIKKSFIKNQDGSLRSSKIETDKNHDRQLIDENKILKEEIRSLKDVIANRDYELDTLKQTTGNLSMKLEKAKAELAENIFNANAEAKIQKVTQKDLKAKMDVKEVKSREQAAKERNKVFR